MTQDMFLYLFTGIVTAAFLLSVWREPRRLINIFLLLFSLLFLYLSGVRLAYENSRPAHVILLLFLYAVVPLTVLGFGVFMVVNGFIVRRKEGKCLANSLSLLMGSGVLLYCASIPAFLFGAYRFASTDNRIWTAVHYTYLFVSMLVFFLSFIFVGFLFYSILYLRLPRRRDYDFIIIHGSGLHKGRYVTPLLAARIEKGIRAFEASDNPGTYMIASGGQGMDEEIAEAEAIRGYMLERGMPEDRILMEDMSTTTFENLKYSKEIAQRMCAEPRYLFVTNNYHVFRTSLYAKRLHMKGEGLGARTAGYYMPTAFIREYIAILVKLKWLLATYVLFAVFLIIVSFT